MATVTDFGIPIPEDTDPLAQVYEFMRNMAAALDGQAVYSSGHMVNNTTALSDVLDLGFLASAGRKYAFEFGLQFACASSVPDARVALHRSAAGDLNWSVVGKKAGLGAGTSGDGEFGGVHHGISSDYIAVGVPSGLSGCVIRGTYLPTVDGSLNLWFAQNVATAVDTTLEDGSYMKVQVCS